MWHYELPPPPDEWIEHVPEEALPERNVVATKISSIDDSAATCAPIRPSIVIIHHLSFSLLSLLLLLLLLVSS